MVRVIFVSYLRKFDYASYEEDTPVNFVPQTHILLPTFRSIIHLKLILKYKVTKGSRIFLHIDNKLKALIY